MILMMASECETEVIHALNRGSNHNFGIQVEPPSLVQPEDVLAVPFDELKACGLSGMKVCHSAALRTWTGM